MHDAQDIIGQEFDNILTKMSDNNSWEISTDREQAIWLIVSTRCEIDMSGFESVFEQLLNRNEILKLIESLNKIDAQELAISFNQALSILDQNDFFNSGSMISEHGEELAKQIESIGENLSNKESMWDLDTKILAHYGPPPNKGFTENGSP